jgi:hypothetical protein
MLQIKHRLMATEVALVTRHTTLFVPDLDVRGQQPNQRSASYS